MGIQSYAPFLSLWEHGLVVVGEIFLVLLFMFVCICMVVLGFAFNCTSHNYWHNRIYVLFCQFVLNSFSIRLVVKWFYFPDAYFEQSWKVTSLLSKKWCNLLTITFMVWWFGIYAYTVVIVWSFCKRNDAIIIMVALNFYWINILFQTFVWLFDNYCKIQSLSCIFCSFIICYAL